MSRENNTISKFGCSKRSNKLITLRGLPGIGFSLTPEKDYDIQNKRLKNLRDPVDVQDGVTCNYVNNRLQAYHINTQKAINDTASLIIAEIKQEVIARFEKSDKQNKFLIEKIKMDLQKYIDIRINKRSDRDNTRLAIPPELMPEVDI